MRIILNAKIFLYKQLKRKLVYVSANPSSLEGFAMTERKDSMPRYNNLYLGKPAHTTVLRKFEVNKPKFIDYAYRTLGMVVLPANNPESRNPGLLTVPDFIDLTIKLPADLNTYYKSLPHTAQSDIRRVKKGGFTLTVSNDAGWCGEYYRDHYKPTMEGRHGDEAYIMPETEIYKRINQEGSEFLKIYQGDKCVAAILGKFKGRSYRCVIISWLNGDYNILKNGGVAALYWNAIQRAFELKCEEIEFGGTPAYLENGVFKFKAKWLTTFSFETPYTTNQLLLNPDNDACWRFLKQTSLIAIGKQNTVFVLSSKRKDEVNLTGPILSDFTAWYLLRNEKAESYADDVSELPPALRYWYERVA